MLIKSLAFYSGMLKGICQAEAMSNNEKIPLVIIELHLSISQSVSQKKILLNRKLRELTGSILGMFISTNNINAL